MAYRFSITDYEIARRTADLAAIDRKSEEVKKAAHEPIAPTGEAWFDDIFCTDHPDYEA